MGKVLWNQAQLSRYLGIERSSIRHYLNKGCPKPVDRKFDVKLFCEFLVQSPVRRNQNKSSARENAQKFLTDTAQGKTPHPDDPPIPKPTLDSIAIIPKPKKKKEKKPTKQKPIIKSPSIGTRSKASCGKVLGMVAALERARQAEVDAHTIYQKALDETHMISAMALENWQKTLEILRKCETDFLKVMERSRMLVEKTEVQSYIETMIETVKQTMLNMPSKMAPSLDGLEWQEIQERLEIEIRDILEGLANYQ